MSILRGGDGGHCSRSHCTVRAYPLLRVISNPLLRVTPLWDSSLNCQLSWEDFQRQASGNHGKERRGLNKGEIRKKNETKKLRGNRQLKKMIPGKKITFFQAKTGHKRSFRNMLHEVEQSRPFSQNQHVVLLLVNPNLGTPQDLAHYLMLNPNFR